MEVGRNKKEEEGLWRRDGMADGELLELVKKFENTVLDWQVGDGGETHMAFFSVGSFFTMMCVCVCVLCVEDRFL